MSKPQQSPSNRILIVDDDEVLLEWRERRDRPGGLALVIFLMLAMPTPM